MFKEYIDSHENELINDLETMIRIPSKLEGYDNPEYPFGKNIDNALNTFLEIGKRMGFRTKNIDKHCGYIEFGEGDELVGIVGHLDVVPEGEGWQHPPFELTIENGKLYGRGTTDDKGPMIASLYAMKAVMEKTVVHKRVRLIIGLNEENDWRCINYYKEHEEQPTVGFSPDADFPCIYAEKALLTSYISETYIEDYKIKIKDIMREAYYVPETKPIDEIFKELQKNKMQMAIVVDEYGGTSGLLTMEDILEELVGNIFDEYDDVEIEYNKIDENTYLIEGSIPLYELKRILAVEIPEGDYDTLSGYLIEKLGRIPDEDEKPVIEDEKLTYKIEELEDRRIKWVKVCKNQEVIEEDEDNKEEQEKNNEE